MATNNDSRRKKDRMREIVARGGNDLGSGRDDVVCVSRDVTEQRCLRSELIGKNNKY